MTILILAALLLDVAVHGHQPMISFYDRFFFYPFQSLRNYLFGFLPFSIGDVLYLAGGLWLVISIILWVRQLIRRNDRKSYAVLSLLKAANIAAVVFIFFLLGWGVNYHKIPLRKAWAYDPTYSLRKDSAALTDFDRYLVARINAMSVGYHPADLAGVCRRSESFYGRCTDTHVVFPGVCVKPSLFSSTLERMGIEGYYNPFTGEGQVDRHLPPFLTPFVTCHEMAHQAGIAAEGDANLMAYAVCISSGDSLFSYSAYLTVWTYINARMHLRDSVVAKQIFSQLNDLSRRHLDTLEQLRKIWDNDVSAYSSDVYDAYLKMQSQKDGVHSYGTISTNAYLFEQRLRQQGARLIHIP